jgi:ABC-type uncharacterized transport system auxiliary subunit
MLGHSTRAAATALAVVTALVLLVAGCGGDKKETYRQEFTKAAEEFKKSAEEASQQIPEAPKLKDRVPALRSFKASIDKLAKDLDGLDPPDDLVKLNDDAVAALKKLSADLGEFEQAAQANDTKAVTELTAKLQVDQAELQATLDKIDQKVGG